jgi:hypothetical protein
MASSFMAALGCIALGACLPADHDEASSEAAATALNAAAANPGFESGDAGWENWGNSVVVNSPVRSGTRALRIGTGAGGRGQTIAVTPGAYTLKAWGMVTRAGEGAWVGATLNGRSAQKHSFPVTSSSFAQGSVRFDVPSDVTSITLWAWKNAGAGQFLVDDFELVSGSGSSAPPAPAPTTPPSGGVKTAKKGVGAWYFGNVKRAMDDLKPAWFYTWADTENWVTTSSNAQFVPMLWGKNDVTPQKLENAKKAASKTLLGFNEPDHPREANLTPAQALALWPQLMSTGLRLGSPASADDPNKWGSWLEQFMQGANAKRYRVDFVCVHWYRNSGNVDADLANLKSFLDATYKKFQKPVWLTEFALIDFSTWPGKYPAPEKNAEFARRVIPMLESLPYLERYAWFSLPSWVSVNAGSNMHLYRDDGTPTPVGLAYRDTKP